MFLLFSCLKCSSLPPLMGPAIPKDLQSVSNKVIVNSVNENSLPKKETPLHPIILIPGDGGSQIEARLNKTSTNHWWCSKVKDIKV